MATILFYKDLSDAHENVEVTPGKSIAENLPDVTEWLSYKIIVNNRFQGSDYVVNENDNILVRRIPFGITAGAAAALYFLGGLALGVGAIRLGVAIYNARKESERIKKELENMQKAANDGVINLPYIRGANNQKATGKTQPYFIGENLFTPYKLNVGSSGYEGFSTIEGTDGETQLYNVVLECGFNKQVFRRVYCDDITLKTFSDDTPQEGKYRLNTGSVFASDKSFIEIKQDGTAFITDDFNKKIIENKVNQTLAIHDPDNPDAYKNLYFTLENNAMAADVCILFNGLRHYTKDGTPGNKTRTVNVEYSVDYADRVAKGETDAESKATWNAFTFDYNGTASNTFTNNTTKQLRYNAHVDFNYFEIFANGKKKYDHPITIRVSTPDEKTAEGQDTADVIVNWVHSYCYNTKNSLNGSFEAEKVIESREAALSTVMGVCIEATAANEDKLNSIQVVTSGVARIWDNTTKKWSTDRVPTSNPAAWLLEVMTSNAHTPSRSTDDEIDLNSFGEWYEFCDTHNYTVNYVISQGLTKSAVYDLILECGRGAMYPTIYGKHAVAIDCVKENAIGILNQENIISLTYDKDIGRRVDGLRVTYIDASADYQEADIIVMYDGSDPANRSADAVLKSVRLDGTTNSREAHIRAMFLMKNSILRPKEIKIEVGEEGIFYTPYSKFGVTHPVIKTGKGTGEIKSVIYDETGKYIIGLEFYDAVDFTETRNYSLIVQAVGENYSIPIQLEAIGTGDRVKECELVTPYPITSNAIPHPNDIFSYGLGTENVIDEMLITGIEHNDGGYILTMVDYDERIVDDNESEIPVYYPDFTKPQKPLNNNVSNGVTFEELNESKQAAKDYTDRTAAELSIKASPQYQVIFNTPVIRKANDGSYSPSNISATAYKTTDTQAEFSGVWEIQVNGENYNTVTASKINLNISDILDVMEYVDTVTVKFKTTGDNPLQIAETVIPVISGASAYSVVLENPGQVYEADENGNVTEHTIKTRARVYYGLKELEYLAADGWEYGIIEPPEGFTISLNTATGELSIKNAAGGTMANYGRIVIPVFIHSQTNTENIAGYEKETRAKVFMYSGYGEKFEGYLTPDESGYFNCYFTFQKLTENAVKLAQLNSKVNGYWEELTNDLKVTTAEKETLRVLLNSVIGEYGSYARYSSYTKYGAYNTAFAELRDAVNIILNSQGVYTFANAEKKTEFNKKFETYYEAKTELDGEISATSTYYGKIEKVADIPTDVKPTDYFLWCGTDKTSITGAILNYGITYTWNGSKWVEDTDNAHIMATMGDTLELLNESTDETIPAVIFAKRLVSMQIVANTILSNYVQVVDIMTKGTTTIDGGKITTGSISAEKINVTDLFAQEINAENMHLSGNSTVEGTVYAKSGQFEGGIGTENTAEFSEMVNNEVLYYYPLGRLELDLIIETDVKTGVEKIINIFIGGKENQGRGGVVIPKIVDIYGTAETVLKNNTPYFIYKYNIGSPTTHKVRKVIFL